MVIASEFVENVLWPETVGCLQQHAVQFQIPLVEFAYVWI
jgi:hypothetical protein